MTAAYAVDTYPPGAFNGWYATVTRTTDGLRGTGYGRTEREAVRTAWNAYWRKADAA